MRVLVTGASGFLGKHVVAALAGRCHEVLGASRRGAGLQLDLADLVAVERLLSDVQPDVVVQTVGEATSEADRLQAAFLEPTLNLLRAVSGLAAPPAVLLAGSAAEYGGADDQFIAETVAARPVTPYGWIKLVETMSALEHARRSGLEVTVFRVFNPVGSGMPLSTALGSFRHQLLNGRGPSRTIAVGRIDVVRDFIPGWYVGDVVAELAEARPGGIVNVCSGLGVALSDVMTAAAAAVGVDVTLANDPELAALPYVQRVVGDPARLHSIVASRVMPTPELLAGALLDDRRPGGE